MTETEEEVKDVDSDLDEVDSSIDAAAVIDTDDAAEETAEEEVTAVAAKPARKRRKKEPVIGGVRRAMLKEAAGAKKAWTTLMKDADPEPLEYTIRAMLEVEQTIKHPTFGVGFIVSVSTGKADVLFEDGVKKLVFNR